MKTNASYRLRASMNDFRPVTADSALHISDWWKELPKPEKIDYLDQHPNSKYAKQAIKEGEESGFQGTKGLEPGSKTRSAIADKFRAAKSTLAREAKRTFPMITNAVGAMGNLASGKPLSHHQKEVMHELGHILLKAGSVHLTGDENAGLALAKLGVTAVEHAIDHFKEKKAQNPKQDDVETYVDALADGVQEAKEAPVPAEHAQPSSKYRKLVSNAMKATVHHTTQIVAKTFSNVKPAMTGLGALAQGKKLDDEQKHAMKEMGKYALVVSIASLPGGLAAHLAAGAGVASLKHAYKAVKGEKVEGRELVGAFVAAIGAGLEHALIQHIAEGGEGGHEGGGEGHGHHGGSESDLEAHDGHHGGGDSDMKLTDVGDHALGFGDMERFKPKGKDA